MQHTRFVLLAAWIACCAPCCASAMGVKIIANPGVATDSISSDDLREIFLQTRSSFSDGSTAVPVLERDGLTHQTFLRLYIGKDNTALQSYYRSLLFTGKASMPRSEASDAEVMAYVARTKGAIGYISDTTPTHDVRVLAVR